MRLKTINIIILLSLVSLFITINISPILAKADIKLDTNKIDEFINSKMKSKKIPGCSIAIVEGDKIIYLKGYGVDGKRKPVTEETPFILGSVSKSFTGLAVAQLMEKGQIDLDAPVQRYLPWFTIADSEASKQITIKQLLSHTSGFSRYDGQVIWLKANNTIEQLVHSLNDIKLTASPGKKFQYSNINYVILGEIVQAVSGIPYEQYIEENIFTPLDMKNSYADPATAYENGLTNGYNSYFGFMLPRKTPSNKALVPAGYLVSSAEDMAHYLLAQMNNGNYNNNSIISEEGMDMTHRALEYRYGMGWFTSWNTVTHGGDTENFHSYVKLDATTKLGIVMLFNTNDYISSALSNTGPYTDIPIGVENIVLQGDPFFLIKSKSDISFARSCINAIGIIVILLLIASIFKLFKWKKKLTLKGFGKGNLIALIIVNALLPLSITLFALYGKVKISPNTVYSTREVAYWAPDFGILIALVPAVLFAICIVKITFLVSYLNDKKRIKGSL